MNACFKWTRLGLLGAVVLTSTAIHARDNIIANHLVETVKACIACHGPGGNSQIPMIPSIGGLPAGYLREAMTTFQERQRPCPEMQLWQGDRPGKITDMCEIASDLSYQDIDTLSVFFSSQPFIPVQQTYDPVLANRGRVLHQVLCEECHTRNGSRPDADAAVLAGQWKSYLQSVLMDFRLGERRMIEDMAKSFKKLEEKDYEALVHFYASQQ